MRGVNTRDKVEHSEVSVFAFTEELPAEIVGQNLFQINSIIIPQSAEAKNTLLHPETEIRIGASIYTIIVPIELPQDIFAQAFLYSSAVVQAVRILTIGGHINA